MNRDAASNAGPIPRLPVAASLCRRVLDLTRSQVYEPHPESPEKRPNSPMKTIVSAIDVKTPFPRKFSSL